MIAVPRSLDPFQRVEDCRGLVLSPPLVRANVADTRAVRIAIGDATHWMPPGWSYRDAIASGGHEIILALAPDRFTVRVFTVHNGRFVEVIGYAPAFKSDVRRVKFGIGR